MVRLWGGRREREAKPEEKEKKYPYRAEHRAELGSGWVPGMDGLHLPDWTRDPVENIGEDGRRHIVPRRRD